MTGLILQPGKGRNDDPGGAEDHQRIAEPGRAEIPVHAPFKQGSARRVTALLCRWHDR